MLLIIKWDLRNNAMITQFEAHSGPVFTVAHTTGQLVSGSSDQRINIWNDEDCSLIRLMEGHTEEVNSVSVNQQKNTLVSSSEDTTCRVWSVKSGKCLRVLKGHTHCIRSVLFADDVILSGSHDKSIRVWNPHTGQELRKITDGIDAMIYDVSLNCDSSLMVCCFWHRFSLFKYPSMEVIRNVDVSTFHSDFHPSIPTILAVSDNQDHSIKIYHTDDSTILRTLKGHVSTVLSFRFSPDGHRLISTPADKTVRVWDVSDVN